MAFAREIPHSFNEALKLARSLLSKSHELVQNAVVDTEAEQIVLAAYRQVTGTVLSRLDLYGRLHDRFPEDAGARVISMGMSRAEGKTLQYLTGYQVFLEHEYEVNPEVLVPRPETEALVTKAISKLASQPKPPALGLEIGLGSGVISIELLSRFPALRMIASELVEGAEKIAVKNAERILGSDVAGAGRLEVLRPLRPDSVLECFNQRIAGEVRADFLISNPPYLAPGDPIDSGVLSFEPSEALFSPVAGDSVFFYRQIAEHAHVFLTPEAWIFVEVPSARSAIIAELFLKNFCEVQIEQDLTGRDRVLLARRSRRFSAKE
jgi:release factor glutamine methyltransferase